MNVRFHSKFKKNRKKLTFKEREQFAERFRLFMVDKFHPTLNNHQLHGKYQGYRSINIGGDLRAVYVQKEENVLFVALDTHSNLYR